MYHVSYYENGELIGIMECYSMDDVKIALDEWMSCKTRVDEIRVKII